MNDINKKLMSVGHCRDIWFKEYLVVEMAEGRGRMRYKGGWW